MGSQKAWQTVAQEICDEMGSCLHYATPEQKALAREYGCWWKFPAETRKDGFGFCYDLAAVALQALIDEGCEEARLLFVRWGDWGFAANSGHFVCVFETEAGYHLIDNGVLKGPFPTFDCLLETAGRGHRVECYRWFTFEQIPFHTSYVSMRMF